MTPQATTQDGTPARLDGGGAPRSRFILDANFGLSVAEKPWSDFLPAHGIDAEAGTDLPHIHQVLVDHEADIGYIPVADFHRLTGKGDRFYRGLAQATSKLTGQARQSALLTVRRDDPARRIADLEGARFGYINDSCSSSYFPPAILLHREGKRLREFLDMTQVEPGPTWQGLIDAVVSGEVRATMALEDTWNALSENAENTRTIAHYTGGLQGVVVVRHDLDTATCTAFLAQLLAWTPPWNTVYGGFKPFHAADVHAFFHDLVELPDEA